MKNVIITSSPKHETSRMLTAQLLLQIKLCCHSLDSSHTLLYDSTRVQDSNQVVSHLAAI